jgi:NAD(P)-dependent dehydrogenase (short-subunit alcohol dehydrogenase family)
MSQLESAMTNYSNFAGRTALVTGGASGLGRAMAEALAATGASLVLFDLNHAQARHLASDLKAKHSIRVEAVEGSVTNSDDVARGCRTAIELTGRLDIVMNNAGIIGNAPSIELEEATWRRVIDVNLTGVFVVAQAAAGNVEDFKIKEGSRSV